jgi:hypothetical protein
LLRCGDGAADHSANPEAEQDATYPRATTTTTTAAVIVLVITAAGRAAARGAVVDVAAVGWAMLGECGGCERERHCGGEGQDGDRPDHCRSPWAARQECPHSIKIMAAGGGSIRHCSQLTKISGANGNNIVIYLRKSCGGG